MDFNLEEDTVQDITLVRIAISLWLHDDCKNFILSLPSYSLTSDEGSKFSYIKPRWTLGKSTLYSRAATLNLPRILERRLLMFIDVVGWQMVLWKEYHMRYLGRDVIANVLHKLQWASCGVIDEIKTVEVLSMDENIHPILRYNLCCMQYSVIRASELKERYGRHFHDYIRMERFWAVKLKSFKYLSESGGEDLDIIAENREEGSLAVPAEVEFCTNGRSEHKYGDQVEDWLAEFQYASRWGNLQGIKHLLQFSTVPDEQELLKEMAAISLQRFQYNPFAYEKLSFSQICKPATALLFLFSKMEGDTLQAIYEKYPFEILSVFLKRPCQKFFVQVAERLLVERLPAKQFEQLIVSACEHKSWLNDHNYVEIIDALLRLRFKDCNEEIYNMVWAVFKRWALRLLHHEDPDILKFFLGKFTPKRKQCFLFSHLGRCACFYLAMESKWGAIEFLLQECISHPTQMARFRMSLKKGFCDKRLRTLQGYSDIRPWYIRFSANKEEWKKLYETVDSVTARMF